MNEETRDQITLSYLRQKDNYARAAELVRDLIEHDQTIPQGTIYTVRSRPKRESRLIEKIDQHNAERTDDQIGAGNYADRVDDLVGLRVVCLLPSAVARIDGLIRSLVDENRLTFVREPVQKKTFDIPLDPKDRDENGVDLQYTGYASNHYVVELGSETAASSAVRGLRVEVQVRTIFEEAWGELDHPRYELARSGVVLPEGVKKGFYILGAQLAVNSINAQYLTDELSRLSTSAERERAEQPEPAGGAKLPLAEVPAPTLDPSSIDEAIARHFGFMPTVRTRAYARRRFAEHAFINRQESTAAEVDRILTEDVLATYEQKYKEVFARKPFSVPELRDEDVIIAVNFALFHDVRPVTATDGLVAILRDRLRRDAKARATSDTEPPVLVDFSIAPRRVRVADRDASITFSARLQDELSGVAGAGYTSSPSQVRFRSPSGGQFVDALFTSHSHLLEGTTNSGLFSDTVRIPRYSEVGSWRLEIFLLVDQVGNTARLTPDDMQSRGLPTSFEVAAE